MQITLDWSAPFTWFIAALLVALLLVQGWFILRNKALPATRKGVRLGLNGLVWLVVAGYFLGVQWPLSRPATHALLIGDEVPLAVARQIGDSLHIRERFSSRALKTDFDSITLVGQAFPTETLTGLSQSVLRWVPYNQPDQVPVLHWKALVRQGEMQRVTARVQSTGTQWLRLRFGRRTLDSASLRGGPNAVTMQFPAFATGRSQVTLALGDNVLDTLRFFTRPTKPMTVQFILDSPDFESKTLANWLGKQGHTVSVSATLSKNISSNLTINKTGRQTPDLLITEPASAGNAIVRKAVADGKAVLFINLASPDTDARLVNRSTGSRFQVRKTTNESLVPIENGLSALPYRFADNLNQLPVTGYPVAVQPIVQPGVSRQGGSAGRVGISLLSETYPLSLSGDSVAYSRIWTAVLARLSPPDRNTILIEAPVFRTVRQAVLLNDPVVRQNTLQIGADTVSLTQSPLNDRSATGYAFFPTPGWQPMQDSLAVYVNELSSGNSAANRAVVGQFMLAHARYPLPVTQRNRVATTQLPDWAWLLLFLVCFTALWIEPKVRVG